MTKTTRLDDEIKSFLDEAANILPPVVAAFFTMRPDSIKRFGVPLLDFAKKLQAKLPKLVDICAAPLVANVPADPHNQYIVANAIAQNIRSGDIADDDIPAFVTYLKRLEPDIAAMVAQEILLARPELTSNEELNNLQI